MKPLSRRHFLRGSTVSLALPLLDVMWPRSANAAAAVPTRMVTVCAALGIHAPHFFPNKDAADFADTPYLRLLGEHRQQFSLFSGLSHPDQAGRDGHSSEQTWLTSARHPGLGGFRNSISLDQLAAEQIGHQTRFPSVTLGTAYNSQSYTRSGVMIPAASKPSEVFAKLFVTGSKDEVERQMRRLSEGHSIMDTVREEAKRLNGRLGPGDRDKLAEYVQSLREMEQRLTQAEAWLQKPKPVVDAKAPADITNEADTIGRMQLLFDLIPLALQTDSTRIITVFVAQRNDVPPVPGVNIDHHNLSHHGKDPDKIRQLELVEKAEFGAVNRLLSALQQKQEGPGNLLDNTMVLFGSNLGNANSHDTHDLPILLAGGGGKHGRHLAHTGESNRPLCDLFVGMLQRLGIETDRFGSSEGVLDWS